MIVMTEEEMQTSISELNSLLKSLGEIALEDNLEDECDCPMSLNKIRLFSVDETESA